MDLAWFQSRYDKVGPGGNGADYINCPMTRVQYDAFVDALIEGAKTRGWPAEHIHFELFTAAAPVAGDQAFEVELAQSGQVLTVPADKTILEVLEDAGCDPMYDCKRGECGVCTAAVLEGVPDHRDYFLSDAEKAGGKLIQICISRAKTPRLVLDL